MRPSWACAVRWDQSGRKGDIDISETMGDIRSKALQTMIVNDRFHEHQQAAPGSGRDCGCLEADGLPPANRVRLSPLRRGRPNASHSAGRPSRALESSPRYGRTGNCPYPLEHGEFPQQCATFQHRLCPRRRSDGSQVWLYRLARGSTPRSPNVRLERSLSIRRPRRSCVDPPPSRCGHGHGPWDVVRHPARSGTPGALRQRVARSAKDVRRDSPLHLIPVSTARSSIKTTGVIRSACWARLICQGRLESDWIEPHGLADRWRESGGRSLVLAKIARNCLDVRGTLCPYGATP